MPGTETGNGRKMFNLLTEHCGGRISLSLSLLPFLPSPWVQQDLLVNSCNPGMRTESLRPAWVTLLLPEWKGKDKRTLWTHTTNIPFSVFLSEKEPRHHLQPNGRQSIDVQSLTQWDGWERSLSTLDPMAADVILTGFLYLFSQKKIHCTMWYKI